MAQGPSDTILVAIRITLRIRESKVRNPDPPDRRRFVLSECISCLCCDKYLVNNKLCLLPVLLAPAEGQRPPRDRFLPYSAAVSNHPTNTWCTCNLKRKFMYSTSSPTPLTRRTHQY